MNPDLVFSRPCSPLPGGVYQLAIVLARDVVVWPDELTDSVHTPIQLVSGAPWYVFDFNRASCDFREESKNSDNGPSFDQILSLSLSSSPELENFLFWKSELPMLALFREAGGERLLGTPHFPLRMTCSWNTGKRASDLNARYITWVGRNVRSAQAYKPWSFLITEEPGSALADGALNPLTHAND